MCGGLLVSGLAGGAAAKSFVALTDPTTDPTTNATTTTSVTTTTTTSTTTPTPDPAPTPVRKRAPAAVKRSRSLPPRSHKVVGRTRVADSTSARRTSQRRSVPRAVTLRNTAAKTRATRHRKHVVRPAHVRNVSEAPTRTTLPERHDALASAGRPQPVEAVTRGGSHLERLSLLFLVLIGFVLLVLPAALAATPARYTPLGERVASHQTDLAFYGLAVSLVPAIVYVILRLGG
jgi:hypothetical protein